MAIAVTIETHIARPPIEVFDALADIDRWPEWLIATGVIRVTRAFDEPPIRGERVKIDQRAAGRASLVDGVVTAMDPPTHFALEGRDADGVSTELDARFAPAPDGGTRLRWAVRIVLPMRYRLFESMATPQVQRAASLDVEAFRRRLESSPTD